VDTSYAPTTGHDRFGLNPGGRLSPAQSELNAVASPGDVGRQDEPWSPSNPLFWVGALAAVTLGLAAVSTTVRVGPVKAGVSVGK